MKNKIDKPSWDEWYMSMAFLIAQKSIDPNTKHGAIFVSPKDFTPLTFGYNGPPNGCNDEDVPLTAPAKYKWLEHAESNAIITAAKKGIILEGSMLYVTGHPCEECFRKLKRLNLQKIIYGPVNSDMISKDDLNIIKKMNNDTIPIIKYVGPVGDSIKRTKDYLLRKCNIKV